MINCMVNSNHARRSIITKETSILWTLGVIAKGLCLSQLVAIEDHTKALDEGNRGDSK